MTNAAALSRWLRIAVLLVAWFGRTAVPAGAVYGVVDEAPAATLLIPYFEVQPDAEEPLRNTRITIVNTDDGEGVLAHATLWTDYGLPTASFTVSLPSRGSIVLDLGELFATASLPFPAFGDSCEALSTDAPFAASALRRAHLGSSSAIFGDMCGAQDWGDGIARGFVTVDTVDECIVETPADDSYFSGIASEDNVLIGHYVIERDAPLSAVAAPAVHIEASSTAAGLETFYYRFGSMMTTDDGREPLPVQSWSATYFTDLSEIICWRDIVLEEPIACDSGILVDLVPLVVFDHAGSEEFDAFGQLCNLATEKVAAGDLQFETEAKTGSFVVEINQPIVAITSSTAFQPRRQSYLSAIHYLHPLGLGIHVPGSAEVGRAAIPLFTTHGADR